MLSLIFPWKTERKKQIDPLRKIHGMHSIKTTRNKPKILLKETDSGRETAKLIMTEKHTWGRAKYRTTEKEFNKKILKKI